MINFPGTTKQKETKGQQSPRQRPGPLESRATPLVQQSLGGSVASAVSVTVRSYVLCLRFLTLVRERQRLGKSNMADH